MKLVTRAQLGWPASAAPNQTDPVLGVKVHYEGTSVPNVAHDKCAGRWTQIRKSHLANKAEGYSDVAYNYAVCQHGYVFEGRRYGKRTGANGNQSLNRTHYAVLVMIGSSGDTVPTPAAIEAIREVIQYLRDHGAGKEIKGHRDGHATACPGDALYALVKNGSLEPRKVQAPKPAPVTYAPFPGAGYFKVGRISKLVTEMGKALERAGYMGYKRGPGPVWTNADKTAYAWWQRKLGYTGSAADGIPGRTSWDKLKVKKP